MGGLSRVPIVRGAQDGEPVRIGQSRKGRGTGGGSVWIEVVVRQITVSL